jgi:hypothetical protein
MNIFSIFRNNINFINECSEIFIDSIEYEIKIITDKKEIMKTILIIKNENSDYRKLEEILKKCYYKYKGIYMERYI